MFMASQPQQNRACRVSRLTRPVTVAESDGIALRRLVGHPAETTLDPFLVIDELRLDGQVNATRFPAQPRRGFESITYMLRGRLRLDEQRDAVVPTGGLHQMVVGRGSVHTEDAVPVRGILHGFQVYLNLPAAEKLQAPHDNIFDAADIPSVIFGNAEIHVIAGRYHGLMGPVVSQATQPLMLDITLQPEAEVVLPVPDGYAALAYVFEGGVAIEQVLVDTGDIAVLTTGTVLKLAAGATASRVLVLAAKPLGEPVVSDGRIFMTSEDEIRQALEDYRAGRF